MPIIAISRRRESNCIGGVIGFVIRWIIDIYAAQYWRDNVRQRLLGTYTSCGTGYSMCAVYVQ